MQLEFILCKYKKINFLEKTTVTNSTLVILDEIKEQAYCDKPDIILIGNKSDLDGWEVETEQAQKLAAEFE